MSGERLAVLTGGQLAESYAKTAHGVLRYGTREVVCVVDAAHTGRRAVDVVPFCASPAPVVADVAAARQLGATTLLLGVAPLGGRLTAAWREALLTALRLGMHVEAGLHTDLRADPELAAAARASGVGIRDLRAVPDDLGVPLAGPVGARVVHTVGSDCAIGKMSVVLELDRAARDRGLGSVFVATGQTGVAIAGWGMAVDHVISDFVAGAADRLVREGAARGDLIWLEGQGSIYHPAYSGVTLGLLHGSSADALVLCHRAGRTAIADYPGTALPPLAVIVRDYEQAAGWVRPARVAAVALNTGGLDDAAARRAFDEAAAETGLVTDDVVRSGAGRVLDAVLAALGPG
ncbi:DUF1611 domain-containing protein [Blastococcus sp. MG754426]|uniref:DUF1611 domain-containing protein n=1 Tax=unclassified Blastococcus TaxID=2619396 RepID=UPI001EEFC8CB|nr:MULTISPECIES: DUF1611 domain-containing protein [unclassified Blastococcus]MCF6509144.1 DUF1611 domain-containing protein [Blastococcus sp. MG754426]MCF6511131.1 DUF1611 domain-containing protein [Blastococcus sp. MG754427]MCF6737577.1 DUF1611 domain-containing protein [Blastococcus sp. KM273129]